MTWLKLACLLLGVAAASAGETAPWPQFHGPRRDNISTETGLLKQWPKEGPPLLWRFSEAGRGYSMVAVAQDLVFTAGDFEGEEYVLALDLSGRLKWKTANGASWTGACPGSRTTPTWHDGVVYHMNPHARVAAMEAATGKTVWSVDLKAELGARHGTWAFSENLLVDGERVYCTPGSPRAIMAALDRRTGKVLWTCGDVKETAGYCSPILVTWKGTRMLITLAQRSVVCVEADTGKLLWAQALTTPYGQNITRPIFHEGQVLVTGGHSGGTRLLRINDDQRGVSEVYHRKELDNCHGGLVLTGNSIYGSACRNGGKDFFCADFATGRTLQADRSLGKLSLTCAEGMLYGIDVKGRINLLALQPGGFALVSRFGVPSDGSRDEYLAHPVVCGKRLYIRHGSTIYCYDIAAR